MTGKHFDIGRWHFFANIHARTTRTISFGRNFTNRKYGPTIYSLVVLGVELSWWRS